MTEQYVFTIVLDDTGDEFSERFNVKDEEQVRLFEQEISDILASNNYTPISVELCKVITSL